jgi:catechol 2,3-dioxygenase-like lactoylglutathione lyase family enzyme
VRISRLILRVADLQRAIDFWSSTVGFAVVQTFENFAFLDGGPIQLVLNEAEGVTSEESLTEIVIEFDDVRAAYDEMAGRGVPFEVDLRSVTGDETRQLLAAHFRDPDGHLASVTGWVAAG